MNAAQRSQRFDVRTDEQMARSFGRGATFQMYGTETVGKSYRVTRCGRVNEGRLTLWARPI